MDLSNELKPRDTVFVGAGAMASQTPKRKEPPAGAPNVGPGSKYVPEDHRPKQQAVEFDWNTLKIPDPQPEKSFDGPPPAEKRILTREELAKRDRESVAYTKSLLVEGDTLVFISYPGESKCFDSTGFEIVAEPHRVHSSRLLATGSKTFTKMLNPTYQYRILRRKKLVGHLPLGVLYVLDLTPPNEGDEAVELISELSCSLGVRLWYTSSVRCRVASNLVEGEDEILVTHNATTHEPTALDNGSSGHQNVVAENVDSPQPEIDNMTTETDIWEHAARVSQKDQVDEAIQLSLDELSKMNAKNKKVDVPKVPEYCPARHRAGIGRLLQVIEGKDPRLDSAPKVWTLFVLAKYFDCTAAVVDWIVTWIMADPNTQFIEILPEASCRMAFGLNNQLICRAAFSILVSEESLSLASRELGHTNADVRSTNQFGRLREDIDEDLRTRIEYASKNFAARVARIFEDLVNNEMTWLTTLPEYRNIEKFIAEISNLSAPHEKCGEWMANADELKNSICTFVRTHILEALSTVLSVDQIIEADKHRRAEDYTKGNVFKNFGNRYNQLHRKERIFTRFFWKIVRNLSFSLNIKDVLPTTLNTGHEGAYYHDAKLSLSNIEACQFKLNQSILDAIKAKCYSGGVIPSEAISYTASTKCIDSKQILHARNRPGPAALPGSTLQSQQFKPRFTLTNWDLVAIPESNSDELNFHGMSTGSSNNWVSDKFAETQSPAAKVVSSTSNMWTPTLDVRTKDVQYSWSEKDVGSYLIEDQVVDQVNDLRTTSNDNGKTSSPHQPGEEKKDLPFRPMQPRIVSQQSEVSEYGNPTNIHTFQNNRRLENVNLPFIPHEADVMGTPVTNPAQFWRNDDDIASTMFDSAQKEFQEVRRRETAKNPPSYSIWHGSEAEPLPKPDDILESNYRVPKDHRIPKSSPFIRVSRLFEQTTNHVRDVANAMLDTREQGFDINITDTVLCLGPEEFKYLPLWAGGDDDGSGGVFDDTIPAALAGPNGPGPSFHTGFSSASDSNSDFDTRSEFTSFNTSVGVEDGHSDHVDRRILIADDDFYSETFSEDSEVYDRKGKGVDRSGIFNSAPPSSMTAFSAAGSESEAEGSVGYSFDVIDNDGDDDDANTTVGQFDQDEDMDMKSNDDGDDNNDSDDDSWDGGDDEAFDFGGTDDEMRDV